MTSIKSPFGFNSTAGEVIEGISLKDKRVIVTGGASGIGAETVKTLARAGAEVIIAARQPDAAKMVADQINSDSGSERVWAARLDLSDLSSVKQFVSDWKGPLHVLVNNAGVMALPDLQQTASGIEMQFMTNYLGHFALTVGLYSALKEAGNARVVMVSSSGHLLSPVIFDDLNFNFRPYDKLLAYGQSKTACNLFAVAATQRWSKDGIYVNALNPGAILTNLQRYVGSRLSSPSELHKTPQQGAATSVFLASSPLVAGIGGRYFENCNEADIVVKRPENYSGVAAYSLDADNAERLWDLSVESTIDF